MVVENRPGAGTVIGTEAVARAAPDGETVLLNNPAFLINPHIKKVSYDPLTRFRSGLQHGGLPAGVRGAGQLAAEVDGRHDRDGEGQARLRDRGQRRHRQPDPHRFRGAEEGDRPGDDLCAVPGAAPAVNALLGGHITAVYSDYGTISGQLKSGALRPIAIGAKKRFAGLPDVPTIPELGYTDYEAESWNGILAPAKMPKETLARLIDWFSAAGNSAPVKEKLGALGLGPTVLCGAEYGASLKRQYERFGTAIRASNLKVE